MDLVPFIFYKRSQLRVGHGISEETGLWTWSNAGTVKSFGALGEGLSVFAL